MFQRIHYFIKAAEKGSFSQAAQEIYISAQALTKQINVLESELGGELFKRTSRGVELTDFGLYAFQKLSKIYKEFDSVLEDVKDYARNRKEQLKIGIFSDLPRDELVSPFMSFLLASCPNYQFQLEMVELYEGLAGIRSDNLDLLLTNMHEEDDMQGFTCLSFGEYDARIVVSLNHPWVMKDEITVEDMKKEAFIKMQMEE